MPTSEGIQFSDKFSIITNLAIIPYKTNNHHGKFGIYFTKADSDFTTSPASGAQNTFLDWDTY